MNDSLKIKKRKNNFSTYYFTNIFNGVFFSTVFFQLLFNLDKNSLEVKIFILCGYHLTIKSINVRISNLI